MTNFSIWLVESGIDEYPEDVKREIDTQLSKVWQELNSSKKMALVSKIPHTTLWNSNLKKIHEVEISLGCKDKKRAKLYVLEKGYGFDCVVVGEEIIHIFEKENESIDVRRNIATFRVVTENINPDDLTILAGCRVGHFSLIKQPVYVFLLELLEGQLYKTNELELLISDELVLLKVNGFCRAYNPFGGIPFITPDYLALLRVD